jgi:hypothetical protein
MSEHEGALFDALIAIAMTVLDLGADPAILRKRLEKARDATSTLGNEHGAETLDFIIDSLFSPTGPEPKSGLRIV